jgi:membrane protein
VFPGTHVGMSEQSTTRDERFTRPENQTSERRAPDGPTDVSGKGWFATAKRTLKEFSDDKLTHWAAALTYYGVLSLFPALLALVSILGIVGPSATQPLIDNLSSLAPGPARDIVTGAVENIQNANSGASTFAFIFGLAAAIWSASGYVAAFMDASNSIWDAPEGRPIYKKLPVRLGVTIVLLVLATILAIAVVATGPIAQEIGNVIGLGDTAVDVWNIAKWPVMLVVVAFMLAFLYWAAPNVEHPKFQWVSPGGLIAVVLWLIASALFALYIANFPPNPAYGAIGGVIAFLTWLWITNIAVLFGAEFNAELERGRQIEAGHVTEEQEPYLPLRDEPKQKD